MPVRQGPGSTSVDLGAPVIPKGLAAGWSAATRATARFPSSVVPLG